MDTIMFKIFEKHKKWIWIIAFAGLLMIQLTVLFFYGNKKSGFHEDEFYSYYSTNKTAGLYEPDREWIDSEHIRQELVVLKDEGFRYGLVAQMQSWDVHPPVYYFLLHTVSSIFPGVFSKWIGIGINIIAFVINYGLLIWISLLLWDEGIERKIARDSTAWNGTLIKEAESSHREGGFMLAFTVCALWGFGAALISSVMFIRMYQWLTVFVMLCAGIHLRAIKKGRMDIPFYVSIAGVIYIGFLTQYYYIIFHVFIGIGFCIWLLLGGDSIKRGLLSCLKYGVCCAIALGGAILTYPASLSHIFRGYRGTEAVGEFADLSNTWERLQFFYGLMNEYVFGNSLEWILLIILLLLLYVNFLRTKGINADYESKGEAENKVIKKGIVLSAGYLILLFACTGYFFTISKTALILGETSNRYQTPIYALVILLLITAIYLLGRQALEQITKEHNQERYKKIATVFLLIALIVIDVSMLMKNKVFFLYEEEKDVMEYVKENADATVLVLYHGDSSPNVWRLSDELIEYNKVYLMNQDNREPIGDEEIVESSRMLVYIADHPDVEGSIDMLLDMNAKISEYELIAEKGLWNLYEFR